MDSLIQWVKIAALAWAGALLVVLLAEMRLVQRVIPDWLRSLARLVLLVGTVGALTLAVLFGAQVMVDALEARAQIESGPPLELSLDSLDSFMLSFYLSLHLQ